MWYCVVCTLYCVVVFTMLTQTSLSFLSCISDALWARLAAEAKKKEDEGGNKGKDGDGKKGEKKKKGKKKRKKEKNAPLVTYVNARAGKKMHGATAL